MMQTTQSLSLINLFFQAELIVQFIMIFLFFMSIFSWSIIFSKYITLKNMIKSITIFENEFWSGQFLAQLYNKFKNDNSNPLSRCFSASMSEWNNIDLNQANENKMKFALERIYDLNILLANKEIDKLKTNISILATISSSAPFIGLLGTVWGIMNSFQSIAAAKNTSLAVVAPGIAEALLATAIGLFAAIPAAICYNLLNNKIRNVENNLYDFIGELHLILQKEVEKRL